MGFCCCKHWISWTTRNTKKNLMHRGNALQKQVTTLQYQWVSHNRTYSMFRSSLSSTKSKLNHNLLTFALQGWSECHLQWAQLYDNLDCKYYLLMSANKSIDKKYNSPKLVFSNQIHLLMWQSFMLLEGLMLNTVLNETG